MGTPDLNIQARNMNPLLRDSVSVTSLPKAIFRFEIRSRSPT
jgi:hypothetical protein